MDYIGTKTKIESLNTQVLAEHIDESSSISTINKKNDATRTRKDHP